MRRLIIFSLSAFLVPLILVSNVNSEDPEKGRLPDGRAYRTDPQGVQLVDYIAELELSIDELKRRVHGLQYEVEEKEDIINALKRNGGEEPKVRETDLLLKRKAEEVLAAPMAECGIIQKQAENKIQSLEKEVSNLRSRLNSNEYELVKYRDMLASKKTNQATDNNLMGQVKGKLAVERTRSVELVQALDKAQKDLEMQRAANEKLKSEVQLVKNDDIATINDLKSKKAKLEQQLSELQEKIEESDRQSDMDRASLSQASLLQIQTAKSELKTLFNRVRGMNFERDRRYGLMQQASSNRVSVKLSALRSRRGLTLDQVSRQINSISLLDEAARLKGDLKEIQLLIKQDLVLLGRIQHL